MMAERKTDNSESVVSNAEVICLRRHCQMTLTGWKTSH